MAIRDSALTTLLLACLLAAPFTALAEPPGGPLTYRGQLTDNGAPANGLYDFEYALYGVASGGQPVDTLTANAREIRNGLIESKLDFMTPNDAAARWLEVRMRPTGSADAFVAIAPRQAMTSQPTTTRLAGTLSSPGASYDVAFPANTVIGGGAAVLLGSVNVPAGSYVAFVRMQVLTDSVAPGTNFRLDCLLTPNFDSNNDYRIGTELNVERYVTFQGAFTLANPGTIKVSCRDGNSHADTILSGKLTVLAVGSVN
ncbi:MAG: hypothetical protein ABIO49_03715 [Dokdonella sp.]